METVAEIHVYMWITEWYKNVGVTQPVPQCPPAPRITAQETPLVGIPQRPPP